MSDDEGMIVICIDAINHAWYKSVKKGYLKKVEVKIDGGTRGVIIGKLEHDIVSVAWETAFVTIREAGEDATHEAKRENMERTPARLVNLLESTGAWTHTNDALQ